MCSSDLEDVTITLNDETITLVRGTSNTYKLPDYGTYEVTATATAAGYRPITKDATLVWTKAEEAPAAPQTQQPPVAAPVETQTPVPEATADGKKKKGKLPKVKKQPSAPTSADEPNWFFLTLSCLVLIAVCFIAYILFAQYMNMYEASQIPIPGFLMPK